MVEADGAGTPGGDSLEFASLAQVYGAAGNECVLGSAKSNAGHTDSAAGAVSLTKAILSLRHGAVPPMLHFTRLPDDLARIDKRMQAIVKEGQSFSRRVVGDDEARAELADERESVKQLGLI